MSAQVRQFRGMAGPWPHLVFAAGLILLVGTAFVWRSWISLGTEALLVPFQCECTWNIRPAPGTLPRTLNDFFDSSGRDWPSLIFLSISGGIVAFRIWRAEHKTWLPLLFGVASVFFLAATFLGTGLAWAVSDWIVGPRMRGIDAGYHRTWYAIAANAILWILFWVALIRLPAVRKVDNDTPAPPPAPQSESLGQTDLAIKRKTT